MEGTNQGQEVSKVIAKEAFVASATSALVALPGYLSQGHSSSLLHIHPCHASLLPLTFRRTEDLGREGLFIATSMYRQWHKVLVKTDLLSQSVIAFFCSVSVIHAFQCCFPGVLQINQVLLFYVLIRNRIL